MYRVKLTPRAQRELDKTSGEDLERIMDVLQRLEDNPRPSGVKKLRSSIHRLRVGNWRIIYAILDKENLVLVGKIVRRSKDTYNRIEELF